MVNVDVSNTTFWHETAISQLAMLITGANSMQDCINKCRQVKASPTGSAMKESYHFAALRRLQKNDMKVLFRGASESKLHHHDWSHQSLVSNFFLDIKNKIHKIHRVSEFTARTYKFDVLDRNTGQTRPNVTVEQYFKDKYNLALQWPELPLLETGRKNVFYPMECCVMEKGQKYPYKLDEAQVCVYVRFPLTEETLAKMYKDCQYDQVCRLEARSP